MSSSYASQKLKVYTTKAFRDSFKEITPRRIGFIFLSKTSQYPNDNLVTDLVDTVQQEKQVWDDMVLAKRVIPKDVELVIPRYNWVAGRRYKQYDDSVPLEELLTESMDGNEVVYPMYVINADGDVYKCLCNNVSQKSFVEPVGNFNENDGFIQTVVGDEPDYLWKYLYNVKRSNKFLTDEWMPVPYIQANTNFTDYNYSDDNVIQGSLNKIVVTDRGSDYFHTEINVSPFIVGTNQLTITDSIDLGISNTINVGMLVSGTGITENETYIANVINPNIITLSQPTTSSGGGNTTQNRITISTRIVIQGDGTETTTSVRLNSNNEIEKINVISPGINYTKANVLIYGSKTENQAQARVVLPPFFGHAYNPAVELGATNVMIISRIGEIDATENDIIPVDIFFRQYGLLVNPYKYDEDVVMGETNSLEVISQTLDLTLLSTSNFEIGEKVYQGSLENPTFVGYVVTQNLNVVKLNNVYKEPLRGSILIGQNSNNRNPIIDFKNPDLKPYAGDILFARNILKVQRSIAQAEEIKLVFQF
jgi:hypothetical protein